jgi:hypothetical protein
VHTWLISLERWFEIAHIGPVGADAERIEVAAAALRGPAQTWWESTRTADADRVAAGGQTALGTWTDVASALRKHFLPQAPELWAIQQLETLTSSGMKDVALYTNQFVALDMLVSAQATGELMRVVSYQRGLPEFYRVRAAEKQHATLAATMEATLALWNAKTAAQAQNSRPAARVSNAENAEEDDGAAQPAAVAPAADRVGRLEQRMDALLTAIQSSRGGFCGGGRGGGNGGTRGRGRDRQQQQRDQPGARLPRARTPDVSEAQARERVAARVCIKCARPNHYARECPNETRKEDGIPTN